MQSDVQVGQVVISKAGRDKGQAMIVCEILDSNYIFVVNGDNHSLEKPKRKNIRHVQKTNKISKVLEEKFNSGEEPTDAQIREEIKRLVPVQNTQTGEHKGGKQV